MVFLFSDLSARVGIFAFGSLLVLRIHVSFLLCAERVLTFDGGLACAVCMLCVEWWVENGRKEARWQGREGSEDVGLEESGAAAAAAASAWIWAL